MAAALSAHQKTIYPVGGSGLVSVVFGAGFRSAQLEIWLAPAGGASFYGHEDGASGNHGRAETTFPG